MTLTSGHCAYNGQWKHDVYKRTKFIDLGVDYQKLSIFREETEKWKKEEEENDPIVHW